MSEVTNVGVNIAEKATLIWNVADMLRGPFKPHEYGLVILPMTVVKRFHDCLLPTHEKVLETFEKVKDLEVVDGFLTRAPGYQFYNTSKFTFDTLVSDPEHIETNFKDYLAGFSSNVQDVLSKFDFDSIIKRMVESNTLYLVIKEFNSQKGYLGPDKISAVDCGYVFEDLVRRFNEAGYQGIEPGDLVVHGMDDFAGAIGISNSRGKATPVLNVMDCAENKRYIMYYLRNMAYNGIFIALATGIRVRSCDTNWNKLKELPYLLPSIEEQKEIVDFIDKKCAEIDAVIAQKNTLLAELEIYKKSLIYEYVTGKKEVGKISDNTTVSIVYPYFPVTINANSLFFAKMVLMAGVLDNFH